MVEGCLEVMACGKVNPSLFVEVPHVGLWLIYRECWLEIPHCGVYKRGGLSCGPLLRNEDEWCWVQPLPLWPGSPLAQGF